MIIINHILKRLGKSQNLPENFPFKPQISAKSQALQGRSLFDMSIGMYLVLVFTVTMFSSTPTVITNVVNGFLF